jgi:pimeloyl-ACP methyl ester carboxylesterase
MQKVETPVLCIVGAQDFMFKHSDGDKIWLNTAKLIPNIKVVTYQSEGHYMFCENPELMAGEVKLFVEQFIQ